VDELEGYKPVAPSKEDELIDSFVVSNMRCTKCKGTMRYEPYTNPKTGSYIARAICEKCGRQVEF
jgi:hypothetical protein